MFQQLYDLIGTSTLIMTLSREGEGALRVNVIPHSHKDDPDAVKTALSKGLTVTGTIGELDDGFLGALTQYAETVKGLRSNLETASRELEATLAAAKAANAKKLADTKGSRKPDLLTKAKAPAPASERDPVAPPAADDDDPEEETGTTAEPAQPAAATSAPTAATAAPDLFATFAA